MNDVRHQPSESGLEQEEVAQLAYELWDRRGRPTGSPDEDWLQAECILSGKQAMKPQTDWAADGREEDGFPEPNWN